jgi:hypothetical protein
MTGARLCRAHFRPFDLAITVTGNGTVISNGTTLECSSTCTFQPRRAEPTLTATPALGWRFDGWGGDCSGSNPTTTLPLTGDRACTAAFSRVSGFFLLTMIVEGGSVSSAPAGVECSSTCVLLFAAGRAFDLTAAETSQSIVSAWSDDCPAGSTTINHVVIDRDKTCRVRFGPRPAYVVAEMTVMPPTPHVGEITTFHSHSYLFDPVTNSRDYSVITQVSWDFGTDGGGPFASSITQHAFQTAGSHTVRLAAVSASLVGYAEVTLNVQEALQPSFTLTLNKTPSGQGAVNTQPPGLFRCHNACNSAALLLESGSTLTLVAVSDAQFQFSGWTGCQSVIGTECTVTMSADRSVTANFVPIVADFTLTVVIVAPPGSLGTIVGSSSNNTINCLASGGASSVCSQTFAPGSATQVRPGAAEAGAGFGSWSGCDSTSGSRCNVTLNSNRTVTATFIQ